MVRTWLVSLALAVALVATMPGGTAVAVASDAGVAAAGTVASDPVQSGTVDAHGSLAGDENVSNATAGSAVAGAVGVGASELEDDLQSRTVAVRLAAAENATAPNASRASVVAAELERARDRLSSIERQRAELRAARANGSIDADEYRVRSARLTAEARGLRDRIAFLKSVAGTLPPVLAEDDGLDPATFEALDRRSANLTDETDARLFRAVVGEYAVGTFDTAAENVTAEYDPPAAFAVRRAAANRSLYREQLRLVEARAGDNAPTEVEAAIDCSRSQLDAADGHLQAAREAVDRGDQSAAREAVAAARAAMDEAADCLERARKRLGEEWETTEFGTRPEFETATEYGSPTGRATPTEYEWEYNRTATPTR